MAKAIVKATIKELEIEEQLPTKSNQKKEEIDKISTLPETNEEKATKENIKDGTDEQKDESKEAQKVGFKYFVKFAPRDTFSVCEKDYYLGLEKEEKENEKVVFFDVKDNYEIGKEMFDFLSAHSNDTFDFELGENMTKIISVTLVR